jgi:hypothetical protein
MPTNLKSEKNKGCDKKAEGKNLEIKYSRRKKIFTINLWNLFIIQ